jgi:hypothetical protein
MSGANDRFNWNIDIGVQKWDEDAVTWLTEKLGRTPPAPTSRPPGCPPTSPTSTTATC